MLLLHGGREVGYGSVPAHRLAYVRMRPFARAVHGRTPDADVALLRYRYRGWNAPDADPVRDTEWALDQLLQTHGDLPVVLVGHSMGGRAALRAAGHPQVRAVVGLAPWLPAGEPIAQLADRDVLLLHGTADLTTSPKSTAAFARAIAPIARRVACVEVGRSGHAMLQRAGTLARPDRRVRRPCHPRIAPARHAARGLRRGRSPAAPNLIQARSGNEGSTVSRRPVQLMGLLTAAYGGALIAKPEVLIRPVGIEDHDTGARVARVLGIRDVLSGLAMIVAPPGPALAVAVAARVASDLSDAASFQGLAPDAQARRKVALAAIGWAAACAITGVIALRGAQN